VISLEFGQGPGCNTCVSSWQSQLADSTASISDPVTDPDKYCKRPRMLLRSKSEAAYKTVLQTAQLGLKT
jgi:hypothetical protein